MKLLSPELQVLTISLKTMNVCMYVCMNDCMLVCLYVPVCAFLFLFHHGKLCILFSDCLTSLLPLLKLT